MTCQEFHRFLHPYVDGELGIDETVAAEAHLAACARCSRLVEGERQFHQFLRHQPKRSASLKLQARIVSQIQRAVTVTTLQRWLVAPILAAAGAALLTAWFLSTLGHPTLLVETLIDTHNAYAQIEQPAEFTSPDRLAVEKWFRQRTGLQVTVPDYSLSGLRLLGGRITEVHGRRAAYLLYEKGHALLSVFMVQAAGLAPDHRGEWVSYRGQRYLKREWKGYRTVAWTDREFAFTLVSMLDYDELLVRANRLLADHRDQT